MVRDLELLRRTVKLALVNSELGRPGSRNALDTKRTSKTFRYSRRMSLCGISSQGLLKGLVGECTMSSTTSPFTGW